MFDSDYFPYAVTILIAIPFLVFAKQFVYGFLNLKKKELQLISGKSNNDIKLQAYERMTLFLERLKPSNLVMKFDKNLAVHEFLFLVEKSINEEFEYNASQQLYVGQTSWDNIVTSKNNVIQLLHKTYENLSEDSKLQDFKTVFLMNYVNDEDYISESIDGLRNDVNKLI
ncbi:hypothetical protein [Soonwooa sp.]|uniref:DUF7935 family protein n=1 Tax=Soonwooa sp. TaxID=1938592 RepID=UPI0028AF8B61|nr:hypothetical protein [Soonwooa sp.]